jgi:hypothetical protein
MSTSHSPVPESSVPGKTRGLDPLRTRWEGTCSTHCTCSRAFPERLDHTRRRRCRCSVASDCPRDTCTDSVHRTKIWKRRVRQRKETKIIQNAVKAKRETYSSHSQAPLSSQTPCPEQTWSVIKPSVSSRYRESGNLMML